MKRIGPDDLENIARGRFLKMIGNSPIPSSVAERFSVGRIFRPDGLTFVINLLPEVKSNNSEYLDDNYSDVVEVCRLDVSALTGDVVVTMVNPVPWLSLD